MKKTYATRICDVCDVTFEPFSYQQLRCGEDCMRVAAARLQKNRVRLERRDPVFLREQRLASRYRMTTDDYSRMVEAQGGACAICGVIPEAKLHIDHDHTCCPGMYTCGRCVRGLLCSPCNRGIAQLKDDPAIVRSAARYLEGANVGS